jgi:hypothetical protein
MRARVCCALLCHAHSDRPKGGREGERDEREEERERKSRERERERVEREERERGKRERRERERREREREREREKRKRERERERVLLGTALHAGGSRASPAPINFEALCCDDQPVAAAQA